MDLATRRRRALERRQVDLETYSQALKESKPVTVKVKGQEVVLTEEVIKSKLEIAQADIRALNQKTRR